MIDFLDNMAEAYYSGSPIISDDEFDALALRYNYYSIGHTVTDGVKHYLPMYSLKKVFDMEDSPLVESLCVQTPKLDGAAVSLLYVGGRLELGLTRGDGVVGRNITAKMRRLAPGSIDRKGVVFVTGEVVSPSSISNARNYASGALNTKSMTDFAQKDVTFVAYDVQPKITPEYTHDMLCLHDEGFKVITEFDASDYPTDGIVYRLNENELYEERGFTSQHPRGAFALKEQKEAVHTVLKDVIWQVGKSGVVSPVAILEPVMIGDALVSKATLHNIEYIRSLDLEIGCMVGVIRSGEIIPRIVGRVDQ